MGTLVVGLLSAVGRIGMLLVSMVGWLCEIFQSVESEDTTIGTGSVDTEYLNAIQCKGRQRVSSLSYSTKGDLPDPVRSVRDAL